MNDKEKIAATKLIKLLEGEVYNYAVQQKEQNPFCNLPAESIMYGWLCKTRALESEINIIGAERVRQLCIKVVEKRGAKNG